MASTTNAARRTPLKANSRMVAIAIIGMLLFIIIAAFAIVGALVVFGIVEDEKRRERELLNDNKNANDNN